MVSLLNFSQLGIYEQKGDISEPFFLQANQFCPSQTLLYHVHGHFWGFLKYDYVSLTLESQELDPESQVCLNTEEHGEQILY